MRIPHRVSVVDEVAGSLREAIRNRELIDHLPSVRKLSSQMHVSVPSILGAIRILQAEGLVQSHTGKPTQILSNHKTPEREERRAQQVIFLTFASNWIAGSDYYQRVLSGLRDFGLQIRVLECVYIRAGMIQREMEKIILTESPDCWVLLGPPEEVQSLFARYGLACIIDGVTIPGLPLPDFEVDYDALYRHAVNHLQQKGHSKIVLITTEQSARMNPDSIETFRSVVGRVSSATMLWQPVHTYDGTSERFHNVLESLFLRSENAPTAIMVATVKRVAGALTWLMNRGLRIPEDVSLISRDFDDLLEGLHPPPSHYKQPPSTFNRFIRAILAILDNKHIRSHHRIMTDFVPGGTVAPAPH